MARKKKQTDQECSAQGLEFTAEEWRLLAYNLPPLEPLAKYAKNQTKFLKIVPKLEVRQDPIYGEDGEIEGYAPVIFKDALVWCDHTGEIKYYFDRVEAQRWIDFVETYGRHCKGEWRGQSIKLEQWQIWIILEFFGWRRIGTPYRRYRFLFDYIPRKNGKSLLFAILALGFLMIDGEQAPEVFDVASSKDQSDTLFEMALFMAGHDKGKDYAHEDILELTDTYKSLIESKHNGGIFRPLPFSPGVFHGKNPHLLIVSEYHAHKTDEMKRVGETGQGVRKQPAVILDTTAGDDKDTPCFEELLMARDIRDGALVMANYLPIIFEAEEDDPWDSLETAKKANPMYGITLMPEFFQGEIDMAKARPTRKREYLQLQLNRYVQDVKCAFDYDQWIKGRKKFDFRDFRGHPIYGGFDLASVDDLCALVNVAAPDGLHGHFYLHGQFWCPEKTIIAKRHQANYELWKERGFIKATPGSATDYAYIEEQIALFHKYLGYKLLHGDRAQATFLAQNLINKEAVPIEFIGQGWVSMTEPIKFLQTLVLRERLHHDNPVMDWMIKHTILYGTDRACRFDKQSPGAKIDGMVALAMAIAAALRCLVEPEDSAGVWFA